MQVQTINISLPKPILLMIDKQAKNEARTRSGLIQEAVRVYLSQKAAWEDIFSYGQKMAKKSKITLKQIEKIVDDYRNNK